MIRYLWFARDAAWLVCGIYGTIPLIWLCIHPFVSFWRARRAGGALFGLIWFLQWCLAWTVTAPWRHRLFYDHAWTWLLAAPFWCVSATMYFLGFRSLSFSQLVGLEEISPGATGRQLVTGGLRARLRHPLYLGHLCTLLGWTLGSGSAACFALTTFAVLSGAFMIPWEERELRARFGAAWDDYASRVPALLTRLW